jgi:hypothetical protein
MMTVEEGNISMVMPKLSCKFTTAVLISHRVNKTSLPPSLPSFSSTPGNLDDAITGKLFKNPKSKIVFAHRLLSALAFLQDNGIVHRYQLYFRVMFAFRYPALLFYEKGYQRWQHYAR